jgi:YVTN family beta-propeller protein
MDETSLRAQLELAVSAEPPIGHLVGNSLRAGRRLRRRRQAAGAASLSAAAVVVVGIVPVLTAGADHQTSRSRPTAGHQTSRSRPTAGRHTSRSRPTAAGHHADARAAYVAVSSNTVIPVKLATNTHGTPIRIPEVIDDPFVIQSATSPNGRTVYEVGSPAGSGTPVTLIDTATNTAGLTIRLGDIGSLQGIAAAPDGKAAYFSATGGLSLISTGTNTASKVTDCSRFGCRAMAFTPDGKTLYVISGADKTVIVIRTATNTVLTRIKLPANSPGIPFNIGVTPNGKTAYVVDGTFEAKPGENSVVPIDLATNTPLPPIKIFAPGSADGLVIAPDGRTAFVLSSRAVTAIDTATNQAEATISLPESAGYAYSMALTPDGKTLYVLTPRGVVPIRTASGTVLPTISVPKLCGLTDIAITPDSRTIYVGACITRPRTVHGVKLRKIVGGGVVPISTATNTAGRFINLGAEPVAITFAR